jgi:CO/xanthine dehydrogenase Mo-binding subunit
MSAAIGNAIHNAVGIRLRDIPMTIDRMFSAPGMWGDGVREGERA